MRRLLAGLMSLALLAAGCSPSTPGSSTAATNQPAATTQGSPTASSAPAAGDIVIGVIEPFSGFAAGAGQDTMDGINLILKQDGSSVQGRNLKFEQSDDGCTPSTAVDAANRLLGKVVAVIGPNCSGAMQAVQPILAANALPHMCPCWLPTLTTGGDTFMFRVTPSDTPMMKVLVDEIKKEGFSKIVIAHDTTGFGVGEKDAIAGAMAAAGLPAPVTVLPYDSSTTDFSGQVGAIRASGADALVIAAFSDTEGLLAKQVRQAGVKMPIFGGASTVDSAFGQVAGSAAEGVIYATAYTFGDPSTADFTKAFQDAYKRDPSIDSLGTAMALWTLMDVFKRNPNATGNDLRDAIRATVLETPAGTTGWDEKGDLKIAAVVLGKWTGGKAVTINRINVGQ